MLGRGTVAHRLPRQFDAASDGGDPTALDLPRPLRDRPLDFSFSGLKTAVITRVEQAKESGTLPPLPDVAASIQEAIVDSLLEKGFGGRTLTLRIQKT